MSHTNTVGRTHLASHSNLQSLPRMKHSARCKRRECPQNVLHNPICVLATSFSRARFLTLITHVSHARKCTIACAAHDSVQKSLLCEFVLFKIPRAFPAQAHAAPEHQPFHFCAPLLSRSLNHVSFLHSSAQACWEGASFDQTLL